MTDPLEQLSDADLQALSKNNMDAMSDEGLKIVAASGSKSEPQEPEEPLGHKLIRKGLPVAGMVAGGLMGEGVGSIPMAAAGNVAGSEAASYLNHKIYGDPAPTYETAADARRIAGEAATGAVSEVGGQLIGTAIKPLAENLAPAASGLMTKAGEAVGRQAGKLAVAATGAGDVLEDSAGQQLLDQGVVKFGDTQPQIAKKLAGVEGADPEAMKPVLDAANETAAKPQGMTAKGLGLSALAGPKGIAGYAAAKTVQPRAMSSMASTANSVSKILTNTPEFFGKWAPALSKAATRGELSLNASVYVLQQQDPEFRQKMQDLNNTAATDK